MRRVKGVNAIAEEIEIRLPSGKKVADDEIAGRAVDILKRRVGFPVNRISVKVEKGIVNLAADRRSSGSLVFSCGGVPDLRLPSRKSENWLWSSSQTVLCCC